MHPIETLITRVGNSSAILVPKVVVQLFGWEPKAILRARFVEGGPVHEVKLRRIGSSIGVIIPSEAMEAHGLERGDRIKVPYHEWQTLRVSQ